MLTKIREILSVGLAVFSSLSLCALVVLFMRNQSLHSDVEALAANNTTLTSVNVEASKAIAQLLNQRKIDTRLLELLDNKYKELAFQSSVVRKGMAELKENDSEFKDLLNRKHPVDLNGLLNSRTSPSTNKDNSIKTTK